MKALIAIRRNLRRVRNFIQRCRDTLWHRRNRRGCSWGEAWTRAGWWQ